MSKLSALLFTWLAVGVACAAWPLFHGWAGWPAEAQTYAQWAVYRATLLPLAPQAALTGIALLLVGAGLLFFRISLGAPVFLLGLLLHGYSKYNAIPTIAASSELGLNAVFYILSGAVLASSLSWGQSRA